jgi:predicted phage terminase large subunit-like protein
MVFMPPRHGKSEIVSRRFPAWWLGKHPDDEVMLASYSAELANRMNRSVQRVLGSPEYREIFPAVALARPGKGESRRQDFFEVAGRRGSLRTMGVGGSATGMGFRLGIVDDPVKNAEEALSPTYRQRVFEWYQTVFSTRRTPDARILITLTRWHPDDLAGRLLELAEKEDGEPWTVLRFPALAEAMACPHDPRSAGQALWPERFSAEWLHQQRRTAGSNWFAAMYQQNPVDAAGGHFRREWFGQWTHAERAGTAGYGLIRSNTTRFISRAECPVFAVVDPAASEKQTADYTAVGIFAATPQNDLLLLEMIRSRPGVEGIVPQLVDVCSRHRPEWLGFEATGFQQAIVTEARRTSGLPPIRELSHEGKSKLVRATPAIIRAEAGQIFLPDTADWKEAFLEELARFSGRGDAHDDQVDVLSYAVLSVTGSHRPDPLPEVPNESGAARRRLWGR